MLRMVLSIGAMCCALMGSLGTGAAAGKSGVQSVGASSFMRIFGAAQAPYGFVQFCESNPEHCKPGAYKTNRFNATPERLSELDEVNRLVNRIIRPYTDQEIYGVSEYWTLPSTVGDCEDYALLKRKVLIERGWPSNVLLLTVVRDEIGDGHAILTVRTQQGDFILDNKISDVRLWNATPYEFVMRQSYVNPKLWVSLDRAYSEAPAEMAGSGKNQ